MGDLDKSASIDFIAEREVFNVYQISDGSTLKVKMVLADVKRNPQDNPDGTPRYDLSWQTVTHVEVPATVRPRIGC